MKIIENKLIVKMKFGSHLYGTATSHSDVDYKGIFLPTREEVLLGKIAKCHSYTSGEEGAKNTKDDIDIELYSLHFFIKLACDGQTVAMDMLHAPQDMLIESSPIWVDIVNNREKFYTKNLKSFINYARRQASKYGIKGSRLSAVRTILDLLEKEDSSKKMREIWHMLPELEHCYHVAPNPDGMRQYQVCGKYFQESAAIDYVIPILQKFSNDYGGRARQASENKNVDWKAVSHALRSAYQTREILTYKRITFPLKEAELLKKVKEGKMDYMSEVAPLLEDLMDEVESLVAESSLPEKVDQKFWDDIICNTLEKELFG
ncbi:MAG: nucleotidyltransferase domain-containing protein [Deltaproteobacteria bacterium]|nr:nucleotidyltransferase domain-containing protein [Deltaproteobacteria bacterium]